MKQPIGVMMGLKKMLPIAFVLLGVIIGIIVIFAIKNEEKTIKIKSFDDKSTFVIGKTKVENYQSSVNFKVKKIRFKVKNGDDFYNEYIKGKDFFNETLVENSDSRKAYLFYDNYYYLYEQMDNEIYISTVYSYIGITEGNFFVITPFYYAYTSNRIMFLLDDMNMTKIKEFYSKFTNDYCKVEGNTIYAKAMEMNYKKEFSITDDYVFKIYEENNEIKCEVIRDNL